MKKIFILLLCICATFANAQNNMTATTTMQRPDWNNMLSNLNTTQITSGILMDKVVDFSKLQSYNIGTNNISDADHFAQSLSQLYHASGGTRFISPDQLKSVVATNSYSSIDVGIINTSFQKLYYSPENPTSAGLLFQNGKYVALPRKPSFVTKKLFMASPLIGMATGNNITFNFKNNLIFTNAASPIKTLLVDFDGTGNVLIINNGSILLPSKTITYNNATVSMLKFTATFQDNTTSTTYAKILLNNIATQALSRTNASPCDEDLREQVEFTSSLPYQGYTETFPVHGKIQTTIFYHIQNNPARLKKMLKPIIVVDGFDPKDVRKAQDCDCERDTNPNPKENCRVINSDKTLIWPGFPIYTETFNPEKHESIEDLMKYNDGKIDPLTGLPRKSNLIKELRDRGYDVILVNNITQSFVHPTIPTVTINLPFGNTVTVPNIVTIDGGADYIERNALTLVSYMQSIKNTVLANGSSEKLVLLGPSMGGQITRYALAYMEKKFAETNLPIWKHDTRLWVSIDSPHLGANIPVGAQAAIWFLGHEMYNGEAAVSFNEKINSIAGKQMIISQFQHAINTATSGTANGGQLNNAPFFTTYYNNLNTNGVAGSNGYPVSIPGTFRKVALLNGSLSGKKDAIEGANFFKINSYIKANWLGLLSPALGLGALLSGEDIKIPALNLDLKFTGGTGQTSNVFRGDGQIFDIALNNWDIQHPAYSLSVTNNSIRGSLDVIPGGYFKTAKIIKEDVEKGLKDAGAIYHTEPYIENHSFIPSFSALGHLQPFQNWANPLNTNLTCPTNKLTPFDSYYGTANNTEHVFFSKETADWLYKELGDNVNPPTPQAPYFPIPQNALAGPDIVCVNNQNTTFSFGDICKVPSAVSNWQVTPNLQIISYNGFNLVVKGISSGQGKITATFSNGLKFEKDIWVGMPASFNSSASISGPTTVYTGGLHQYSYTGGLPQGATSFEWRLPYPYETVPVFDYFGQNWQKLQGSDGNGIMAFTGYAGNNGYVQVMGKNQCGCGGSKSLYVKHFRSGSGGPRSGGIPRMANPNQEEPIIINNLTKIFPNPATDIVNIEFNQNNTTDAIIGELFDLLGKSILKVEIKENKGSFSVAGLNKGIYILRIYGNKEIESQKIIVE